jgi:opine dehydrogenase
LKTPWHFVLGWHSGQGEGPTVVRAIQQSVQEGCDRIPTCGLSVAVLGAGHGGLALAGFLNLMGHQVALWNRTEDRIAPVARIGGVWLKSPGQAEQFTSIASATSAMGPALADAEVVLVAVPASAHADIARQCAPYLRDGQTVLLLPGRTGGALEFRRTLLRAGCHAHIVLGEASTFPFAARATGSATATIFGTKKEVQVAALPATSTPELLATCRRLLPMLAPAKSVLETSLGNFGAILHPTITLLNADRIARAECFDFYSEGVTPDVADVLALADAERLRVARAYGVAAESLRDWVASSYGHRAGTLLESVAGNPAYLGIKAPTTLHHRYLTEDVPTGLIPLLALGEAAGVAMPKCRELVDLARAKLGGEHWGTPRTLDALDLAGRTVGEIRDIVSGVAVTVPARPTVGWFHTDPVSSIPTGV